MAKRKQKKRDPNNEWFIGIMDEYDLHRRDVGRLLFKGITAQNTCSSVDKWLKFPGMTNYRPMHDADRRLLELELQLMDEGHPAARNDVLLEGRPDPDVILDKARSARKFN